MVHGFRFYQIPTACSTRFRPAKVRGSGALSGTGHFRPLHLFRLVVLRRAVGGEHDLERPQAVQAARSRGGTLGYTLQKILQHEHVHVLARVRPGGTPGLVVEDRQALGEGVNVQNPRGAGDPERHVSPGRVALPAGPARVYGRERPVGYDAAIELERQDGTVVDVLGAEERADLGVDALRLCAEHPAQSVGDVDRVVHDRPASCQIAIEEPAAGDLAVVRAVDREHAPDSARAHDLPGLPDSGEVTHREGDPELPPGIHGGLDHGPRVTDRRGDRLLAEHVRSMLEGRDHIPRVVAVLGADYHRVYGLEETPRVVEVADAEPLRCLTTAGAIVVHDAHEVGGVERREHVRVLRSVDVGEAHQPDPDAHPRPLSATDLPVFTDSMAAWPILRAS